MARGIGDQTAKSLAPSSWQGIAVWAVLAVVFISHPWESTKLVSSTVVGTGRWVGYTAFADCGTEPPMTWMATKQCQALPDDNPPAPDGPTVEGTGEATGSIADQAVVEIVELHELVEHTLNNDDSEGVGS